MTVPNRRRDSWDPESYRAWYQTPLGRQVNADEQAVVFALAAIEPGEHALDLGCGYGNYAVSVAARGARTLGVDRSASMLRAATTRAGASTVRWVRADAAHLPFRDKSFDVVVAVTVLCFATDRPSLMCEAYRILRPGGRIVLGELGRYSTWALYRRIRGWFGATRWRNAHFFGRRELESLLQDAGFAELTIRSAVFYPPNPTGGPPGASRLLERHMARWFSWSAAFIAVRAARPPIDRADNRST